MKARKPVFLVSYENVDVSDELAPHIVSVEYSDVKKGGSDELTITVENRDQRWFNGWYPSPADHLTMKFGYEDEPLLDCGSFNVDQLDFTCGTDTVQIKALAAAVGKPVRSVVHRAFDDTTLKKIADTLASELALTVVGDVADVAIKRATQGETTLAFLHRLAESYGYAFSIRGDKLVFFEIGKLDKSPAVVTIDRKEIEPGARFSSKSAKTYIACELSFFDAQEKKKITVRVDEPNARQKVVVVDSAASSSSAAPTLPTVTLKSGSTGEDVKKWQTFLASRGIDTGAIDGIFGPVTRSATMTFQKQFGLVVDGIAGPETYRAAAAAGFGDSGPKTHAEAAGNVLRIERRVETIEQAKLQAAAELAKANRVKVTGSGLVIVGRTKLVAGATLNITGFGDKVSGKFTVEKSTHKMDRNGGYKTSFDVTGV